MQKLVTKLKLWLQEQTACIAIAEKKSHTAQASIYTHFGQGWWAGLLLARYDNGMPSHSCQEMLCCFGAEHHRIVT